MTWAFVQQASSRRIPAETHLKTSQTRRVHRDLLLAAASVAVHSGGSPLPRILCQRVSEPCGSASINRMGRSRRCLGRQVRGQRAFARAAFM